MMPLRDVKFNAAAWTTAPVGKLVFTFLHVILRRKTFPSLSCHHFIVACLLKMPRQPVMNPVLQEIIGNARATNFAFLQLRVNYTLLPTAGFPGMMQQQTAVIHVPVACQKTVQPIKPVFRQPLATRVAHSSAVLLLRMRLLNVLIYVLQERALNAPMASVVILTQCVIRLERKEIQVIPYLHLYLHLITSLQIHIIVGLVLTMLRCIAHIPVPQVYQKSAQKVKCVLLERLVLTRNRSFVGDLGMMQPLHVPLLVGRIQVQFVLMASSVLASLHV